MALSFPGEVGKNVRDSAAKEISNSVVKFFKKTIKKAVVLEKIIAPSPRNNKKISDTNDGKVICHTYLIISRCCYHSIILFKTNANISFKFKRADVRDDSKPHKASREADDEQLKKSLQGIFERPQHNLKWNDLIGLEKVKEDIEIAVELPLKQPQLFRNRKPCQFLLLYGSPGTGKTQVARILAATTNRPFGIVTASDVMSKWVGDSARLVRLLFEVAREMKPAIIFFDEIDVICGRRTTNANRSDSELKAELLVQMSGAKADNDGIFFIGATNLRDQLDPAFLSRFEEQIHIPLPSPNARMKILSQNIGDTEIEIPRMDDLKRQGLNSKQVELQFCRLLEDLTEGFPGRDMKRLAEEALPDICEELCMLNNGRQCQCAYVV